MAECYNIVCPYCLDYSCKRTATCDMRLDGEYVKVRHGRWIYDDEAYPGGNPYGHYDYKIAGGATW